MNRLKKSLVLSTMLTLSMNGYALAGDIKMASVAKGDNSISLSKENKPLTIQPGSITAKMQCKNSDDYAFVAVYQQGLPTDVQFLENMQIMQPLSDKGNWNSPTKGSATLTHKIDAGKYVATFYCVDRPKGSYAANGSIEIMVK